MLRSAEEDEDGVEGSGQGRLPFAEPIGDCCEFTFSLFVGLGVEGPDSPSPFSLMILKLWIT